LETIPCIIFKIAFIEFAIRIPFDADAISFVICIDSFVNLSIRRSVLSYSMSLIPVPAAIIFAPIRPSVDAGPVFLAILIVSLVHLSAYKCCDSLAMRLVIKYLTLIFDTASINDHSSYLDILFPFS
jgi:hypothetical protein